MSNKNNFGSEVGRVQWFDQKKGYGFVKLITLSSDRVNEDIFFHFTSINSINTFKKVYPGEYVSFDIIDAEPDSNKKSKCSNITGLFGGNLLVDNTEYIIKVTKKKVIKSEDNSQDDGDNFVDVGGEDEGEGEGE